jgi:hypothetical protein
MSEPNCLPSPTPATPETAPASAGRYRAVWLDTLTDAPEREVPWLWQGYLARGHVTLLTSQWKMGKTTLLAVLLGRMAAGGTLAGLDVAAGRAVVVSEEGNDLWEPRVRRLGLGRQVCLLSRPLAGKRTLAGWLDLLDFVGELHRQHGLALVVIDSIGELLPAGAERGAGAMLEALLPLRRLTEAGVAVLLLHHPRKGACADGQAARGSGALAAFVDVLVEMHWYTRGAEADRRRRLVGWSRLEGTPRQLVIELNAEGTDYLAHGDFAEDEYGPGWEALRAVLGHAPDKLTREEILRAWPEGEGAPSRVALAGAGGGGGAGAARGAGAEGRALSLLVARERGGVGGGPAVAARARPRRGAALPGRGRGGPEGPGRAAGAVTGPGGECPRVDWPKSGQGRQAPARHVPHCVVAQQLPADQASGGEFGTSLRKTA